MTSQEFFLILAGMLACIIGIISLGLLIQAHLLYTRAVDILIVAYDWLEQNRRGQEAEHHEGTD